jgi:hypothetical protein
MVHQGYRQVEESFSMEG